MLIKIPVQFVCGSLFTKKTMFVKVVIHNLQNDLNDLSIQKMPHCSSNLNPRQHVIQAKV